MEPRRLTDEEKQHLMAIYAAILVRDAGKGLDSRPHQVAEAIDLFETGRLWWIPAGGRIGKIRVEPDGSWSL